MAQSFRHFQYDSQHNSQTKLLPTAIWLFLWAVYGAERVSLIIGLDIIKLQFYLQWLDIFLTEVCFFKSIIESKMLISYETIWLPI